MLMQNLDVIIVLLNCILWEKYKTKKGECLILVINGIFYIDFLYLMLITGSSERRWSDRPYYRTGWRPRFHCGRRMA